MIGTRGPGGSEATGKQLTFHEQQVDVGGYPVTYRVAGAGDPVVLVRTP